MTHDIADMNSLSIIERYSFLIQGTEGREELEELSALEDHIINALDYAKIVENPKIRPKYKNGEYDVFFDVRDPMELTHLLTRKLDIDKEYDRIWFDYAMVAISQYRTLRRALLEKGKIKWH
jgi:hypothetical protein